MTKNTIAAVIISMIFLVLWTWFYQLPRQKMATLAMKESKPQSEVPLKTAQPLSATPVGKTEPKQTTVELSGAKITFSEIGGAIVKYELKEKATSVDLVIKDGDFFSTYPEISARLYKDQNSVSSLQNIDNIKLKKTYFFNDATLEKIRFEVANTAPQKVDFDLKIKMSGGIGGDGVDEKENVSLNKIQTLDGGTLVTMKSGSRPLANAKWVANHNRYFLLAVVPEQAFTTENLEVLPKTNNSPAVAYLSTKISLKPNASQTFTYRIIAGGKSYDTLKKTGMGFEKTVDFGILGGLGKFFLSALGTINKTTKNYGWAIVVLSLGIQIITLPLSLKSLRAAADMKRLQPHLKEIQQKFKNDPKRMNIEVMNLYKTHHVNPLSGCLPMLLQMPIFWALFTTLRNAYELRHAPWIFWIKDLSAHDPFYVLPLLMGAGMFAQQIMTGATADPQNKMMGYIFPAVFTFMFLKFPSGVVLYWLINSVLTIILQLVAIEKEVIKEHRVVKS